MVSIRKKRQSIRRLLSQLDDLDQDMITGNAASEKQENIVFNEDTNDRDFTVSISSSNTAVNEGTVNVKTLERCFNERIYREKNNIIDTVQDKIENAILTAIDNIVASKIELAIRSVNASSGRDVISVIANSDRGEHAGINAFFEIASENNNICNGNDETRNNIPNKISELSVPETHFDRQTHTHHMVTGRTAQTNQIPEFLTGCILTPLNPPTHQHQNLSTQVSQDNNLPMVEQSPRKQNFDANIFINRLVDAIGGIATQQRPQAATMVKPLSTNTLVWMGKTKNLNFLKTYFTQCSKCNQR